MIELVMKPFAHLALKKPATKNRCQNCDHKMELLSHKEARCLICCDGIIDGFQNRGSTTDIVFVTTTPSKLNG
jgi:hypothetical protein